MSEKFFVYNISLFLFFSLCSKDPLIYLNYAIALYNIDKKTAAANQFKTFQTKLRSTSSDRHIDPEVCGA